MTARTMEPDQGLHAAQPASGECFAQSGSSPPAGAVTKPAPAPTPDDIARFPDPDPRDLVRELRAALGLPHVALPESYAFAWAQALAAVRRLREEEVPNGPQAE